MKNAPIPEQQWPEKSLTSIGVLYEPLQDIAIFVEDAGSEVFYQEFISRILDPDGCRIKKVVALSGREQVLAEAQRYNGKIPALFVIDGDLSWVAGDPVPQCPHLFQHPCYCIENYLFCVKAAVEIIFDCDGKTAREELEKNLRWESFRLSIKETLIDLFVAYATAHKLSAPVKTVSNPVRDFLSQRSRTQTEIDPEKVQQFLNDFEAMVLGNGISKQKYDEVRDFIKNRIQKLDDPLDAISGKNYLFPLLEIHLQKFYAGNSISSCSFKMRLAKNCDLSKTTSLKSALLRQIKGSGTVEVGAGVSPRI